MLTLAFTVTGLYSIAISSQCAEGEMVYAGMCTRIPMWHDSFCFHYYPAMSVSIDLRTVVFYLLGVSHPKSPLFLPLHKREAVGKWRSGERFNAMPSIASESALLQNRMKLYSPTIFELRRKN